MDEGGGGFLQGKAESVLHKQGRVKQDVFASFVLRHLIMCPVLKNITS
jgi:hypothetical protein